MPSVPLLRYVQLSSLQLVDGSRSCLIRSPGAQSVHKCRARVASRDATANTAAFEVVDCSTTRRVCVSRPSHGHYRWLIVRPTSVVVAFGSEAATFCCPEGQDCAHRERQQDAGSAATMRLRGAARPTSAQYGRKITDAVTRMQIGGHDQRGQSRSGGHLLSIVLWQVWQFVSAKRGPSANQARPWGGLF